MVKCVIHEGFRLKDEGFRSRCCGFKLAMAGKGVQVRFMVINVLFQGFCGEFSVFSDQVFSDQVFSRDPGGG